MFTRRDAIRLGAGGTAGLLLGPGLPSPARAQAMTPLASLSTQNFNESTLKVLSRSDRIAMPSYRFGVVMRSGIAATGSSGSVQMESTADLVGVDAAMLRQIAHEAFSDFVGKIRATGRTVLGWEEITASTGFGRFEQTPAPFIKKPFADARTVALVSPEYLPLISLHTDAPLSDKSPFELGNWRAINAISAQLKCLVMIPTVVLDFAALTGSGHKVYGGSASVGIQPGLYLVPLFTQFSFFHAKIALAGEGGKLILEDRVSVGQAGTLVQTSNYNNREEVERWNSYANSLAWWNEPGAITPSRPSLAYEYSTYQYRVDPATFGEACLDAARAANTIYAGAVNANPPA